MEDQWKQEDSWDGSYEDGNGPPKWKFWASWSKKKRLVVGCIVAVLLLLVIVIPVALVVSKKGGSSNSDSSSSSSSSGSPSNSNLNGISRDSIPVSRTELCSDKPY